MSKTGPFVDPNYIVQLERGRIRVPKQHLKQFATVFDTTEARLLQIAGVITEPEASATARANPFSQDDPRYDIVESLNDLNDEQVWQVQQYLEFVISQSRPRSRHGEGAETYADRGATANRARSAN